MARNVSTGQGIISAMTKKPFASSSKLGNPLAAAGAASAERENKKGRQTRERPNPKSKP